MSLTKQQLLDADLGDPKTYRITRDGDRDIQCKGWEIGTGSTYDAMRSTTRWTTVTIYLTTGGNLVTQRGSITQWQGEDDHYAAAIHREPADALAWLVADGGDYLGPASKEAWEEACTTVPALEDHDTELVD